MTPAQRLLMSARQSGEQAQRLLAWLRSGSTERAETASLVDEVDSIAGTVGRIIEAIDLRPAVGLAGGDGSGRMALLSALTRSSDRALRAEFANREASLDVLASILPHHDGAELCAAVRLTRAELPQAPRGFPVHLRLLGQLDLIKLIFRAHASHFACETKRLPSARSIAALFAGAERHVQPRAVAGLSARDIVELREDLHGFAPQSPLIRSLAACGYWDRLALIVAHLPEAERTTLLAPLWGEEPALTALYSLLLGAIEKLGHASEIFCELPSIVTRETATGWLVPHRSSIIATETLAGLVHALEPVPASTIQVSGRFGGTIAVDRAVIAALAAELPLTTQVPPVDGLQEADMVTFPGSTPVSDIIGPAADSGLGIEAAVAIVANAKSAYLLERAARRHQLASLVVTFAPEQPPDDQLASAIGDWIDAAQGADPHHRERVRASLFVVVSRPPQAPDALSGIMPWREAAGDPAVQRWMEDGLGADQDWPREWTPNHRFESYFAFHRPTNAVAAGRAGETHLRLVQDHPAPAPAPWNAAGAPVGPLVGALAAVATRAKKHRQLGLYLAEQRRRLRSRVLRHHLSNDPLEIAEWRRQVANVAISRLRRPMPGARDHGISAGALVAALGVSVTEIRAALETAFRRDGAPAEPARPSAGLPLANADAALENPSICHYSASAAVTYWLRSVRQAGRSARFCRHLGVPQTVLQHVLDEIAIGAVRTGLLAGMTAALERLPPAAGRVDSATHFAPTCAREIGTYLASIPQADARPERSLELLAAGERPHQVTALRSIEGPGPVLAAARTGRAFGAIGWTSAVAALVEENISAVPGLAETAERDRELGDLLAGFASSPFEVEL